MKIVHIIRAYFNLVGLFLRHPIQNIYVNFKLLPVRQAIRFPIFIYSKTKFRSLKGGVIIHGKVSPCMIRIGNDTCYVATSKPCSVWTIDGLIEFNGPISFLYGTYVLVAEGAKLIFGKESFIGSETKIICFDNIHFGNVVHITWECQIMDTSFHYVEDENGNIKSLTKPIMIKDNVWVGNRTTIGKGSVIPKYSIIASNSLVSKDLSSFGEHCMFAGIPVKLKQSGITRIFDEEEQSGLDNKFGYIRIKL